jgi:MOSC domain-containing protein YiiM
VIKDINLLALKTRRFRIGEAVFQAAGFSHPCLRMGKILGVGGYNAMRGHGGLTPQIIKDGLIKVGDNLTALPDEDIHCEQMPH